MSEGWYEIASLGKRGEKYPQIRVDSQGWCLRLAPRDRDEGRSTTPRSPPFSKDFIRKNRAIATMVAEKQDSLVQKLQEPNELHEEVERLWRELRLRLVGSSNETPGLPQSKDAALGCRIAAPASQGGPTFRCNRWTGSQGFPSEGSGALNILDSW